MLEEDDAVVNKNATKRIVARKRADVFINFYNTIFFKRKDTGERDKFYFIKSRCETLEHELVVLVMSRKILVGENLMDCVSSYCLNFHIHR